eukprot:jgi/Bigna1/67813/fgenesh1_pg.4_\
MGKNNVDRRIIILVDDWDKLFPSDMEICRAKVISKEKEDKLQDVSQEVVRGSDGTSFGGKMKLKLRALLHFLSCMVLACRSRSSVRICIVIHGWKLLGLPDWVDKDALSCFLHRSYKLMRTDVSRLIVQDKTEFVQRTKNILKAKTMKGVQSNGGIIDTFILTNLDLPPASCTGQRWLMLEENILKRCQRSRCHLVSSWPPKMTIPSPKFEVEKNDFSNSCSTWEKLSIWKRIETWQRFANATSISLELKALQISSNRIQLEDRNYSSQIDLPYQSIFGLSDADINYCLSAWRFQITFSPTWAPIVVAKAMFLHEQLPDSNENTIRCLKLKPYKLIEYDRTRLYRFSNEAYVVTDGSDDAFAGGTKEFDSLKMKLSNKRLILHGRSPEMKYDSIYSLSFDSQRDAFVIQKFHSHGASLFKQLFTAISFISCDSKGSVIDFEESQTPSKELLPKLDDCKFFGPSEGPTSKRRKVRTSNEKNTNIEMPMHLPSQESLRHLEHLWILASKEEEETRYEMSRKNIARSSANTRGIIDMKFLHDKRLREPKPAHKFMSPNSIVKKCVKIRRGKNGKLRNQNIQLKRELILDDQFSCEAQGEEETLRRTRRSHLSSQCGGEFGTMILEHQIFPTKIEKFGIKRRSSSSKKVSSSSSISKRKLLHRESVIKGTSRTKIGQLIEKPEDHLNSENKILVDTDEILKKNITKLKSCLNCVLREHLPRKDQRYGAAFKKIKDILQLLYGTERLKETRLSTKEIHSFMQTRLSIKDVLCSVLAQLKS